MILYVLFFAVDENFASVKWHHTLGYIGKDITDILAKELPFRVIKKLTYLVMLEKKLIKVFW